MSISSVSQFVKVSVIASLLIGASAGVHAAPEMQLPISQQLELQLRMQMQDMLRQSQQELTMMLKTQFASAKFEMQSKAAMPEMLNMPKSEAIAIESAITSAMTRAMVKD